MNPNPNDDLLISAASIPLRTLRDAATARATLHDREKHVDEGRHLRERAHLARDEFLRVEARLRAAVKRPRWLTAGMNFWAKVLLVLSDIGAGTASLVIGGDPLWLAVLTFTGVAVSSVLAGTYVGIHARRRAEGDVGGMLHWLAVVSVALGATMFGMYRYLTVGAVFAVLAFIPVMVALGSAFLGYLWQDKSADEIERAKDSYLELERDAEDQFSKKVVRRFEKADSNLRLAALAALNDAYQHSKIQPSVWEQQAPAQPLSPPNGAMVERLLAIVVGPEILTVTPKVDVKTALAAPKAVNGDNHKQDAVGQADVEHLFTESTHDDDAVA